MILFLILLGISFLIAIIAGISYYNGFTVAGKGESVAWGFLIFLFGVLISLIITFTASSIWCVSQEPEWAISEEHILIQNEDSKYYIEEEIVDGRVIWRYNYESEFGIETKNISSTSTRRDVPKDEVPKVIYYHKEIANNDWFWVLPTVGEETKTVLQANKDMIDYYKGEDK